jgi:hypothetical protein
MLNNRRQSANAQRQFGRSFLAASIAIAASGATLSVHAEDEGVRPASSSSFYVFPQTPKFNISDHGNLVGLEGPVGDEHVYSEGYVLCYGAVNTYDLGSSESGFASPTTRSCSGNKCTITRNTSDGFMQLKQVLTKNSTEARSLAIEMTVKNLRGTAMPNVVLRRDAHFHIDGSTTNWRGATELDSVFSWNAAGDSSNLGNSVTLRQVKRTPTSITYSPKVVNVSDSSCNPANLAAGGPSRAHRSMTMQYNVGTLGAGKSAVITVEYARN